MMWSGEFSDEENPKGTVRRGLLASICAVSTVVCECVRGFIGFGRTGDVLATNVLKFGGAGNSGSGNDRIPVPVSNCVWLKPDLNSVRGPILENIYTCGVEGRFPCGCVRRI